MEIIAFIILLVILFIVFHNIKHNYNELKNKEIRDESNLRLQILSTEDTLGDRIKLQKEEIEKIKEDLTKVVQSYNNVLIPSIKQLQVMFLEEKSDLTITRPELNAVESVKSRLKYVTDSDAKKIWRFLEQYCNVLDGTATIPAYRVLDALSMIDQDKIEYKG